MLSSIKLVLTLVATNEHLNGWIALELSGIYELMRLVYEIFTLRQSFTLRTNFWVWIQIKQDWKNKSKEKILS